MRSCRAPRPPIQAWPMSVGALSQEAPFAARAQPRAPAPSAGGPVQPVHLGPLPLPNRYFLAPLAGVSDWPFRLLCREMGAAIAHTEMISSHGLVHGGDQTLSYLERPATERPFAIQVFGHDPDVLAAGARVAVEKYGPIDAVDINMGCPVKKVCGHGAGAAMLKDPGLVERTVRKVVEAIAPVPVTVKLRSGWDEQSRNAPLIARACEQGGAVAVGLHPRTRADRPNGGHEHGELDPREAELAAIRELRKHLLWYTRGRRGGLAFRRIAPELHTEDDVKRALDRFFPEDGSIPPEVRDEPVTARDLTADD